MALEPIHNPQHTMEVFLCQSHRSVQFNDNTIEKQLRETEIYSGRKAFEQAMFVAIECGRVTILGEVI